MSIFSQKTNVFDQIAILKTTNEIVVNRDILKNQANSLLDGDKSSKDPFQFLIKLLTVVSGSDIINKAIKNMVSNIGNIDIAFKSKIKDEITATLGGTKNDSSLPTTIRNGYQVHINKLDPNGTLFTAPGTPEHDLYLSDFQKSLQTAVTTPNTNSKINDSVTAEYNPTSGFFTFHPVDGNAKYKDFLFGLVDNTKFNDPKSIVTNTFSDIFNGKNLNKDQLITNQYVNMSLDNMITQSEEDDSYFTFDGDQSQLVTEKIVTNFGFYNDLGSTQVTATLSNTDLLASINKNSSLNTAFFTDVTSKIASSVDTSSQQSVANSFSSTFLTGFKTNIVKNYVSSPQSMLIYSLVNNAATPDATLNPLADLQQNKNIILCLIKSVLNQLMASLFNMLKKDLLAIVAGVTALYIQESADKYKKILQSLFKSII